MESDSTPTSSASARFVARAPAPEAAERFAAEAWEAGAQGLEERDLAGGGVELVIYAASDRVEAVRLAVLATADPSSVDPSEPVPDEDWSERWKRDLRAVEVSPRLRVRPSFLAAAQPPVACDLVIDPGQAFGTGGHESTRLCLEWIDAVAPGLPAGARVLDVGTGTGVLALAAIRLAGASAVAFDLDPLAATAARENAVRNGVLSGLDLFTGPLEALAPVRFDLVVANLLKRELLPLVAGIAARTTRGGAAIFSGLLSRERDEVVAALASVGFAAAGQRDAVDASGEGWTALLMTL